MKFSEAAIKGYSHPQIQGRQARNLNFFKDKFGYPTCGFTEETTCCCFMGSAEIGGAGGRHSSKANKFENTFLEKVGINVHELNEKMDWQDIVGIAIAEGL